ncbi:MAG: alpha/beta hydrolase, partial [Lewinella sp.]|nr:alpha/beta hydrolase [Lewinella sp.]
MYRKKITLFLLCLLGAVAQSQAQELILLWPAGEMPNSRGLERTDEEARQRITRVAEPGMYAFFTSQEEQKGSAVLICPPGGYGKLAYQIAGFQFAKWLNTLGIHAFVLIHRLPTEPDLITREQGPLQDAQRALKIIRSRAAEWAIDPDRIGVMGASAGGHLASTLGT